MIEHIPELIKAGIDSFKIEGRNKTAYYTACVTGAYRAAIDAYLADPEHYVMPQFCLDEVNKVSHRGVLHRLLLRSFCQRSALRRQPVYPRL